MDNEKQRLLSDLRVALAKRSSRWSLPIQRTPKFLHCAQAARADFIVTGNKRDFPDGPYGPTRVVSAGELLDRITLEM